MFFKYIDTDIFAGAPLSSSNGNIGTYYRLLILDVIPNQVDRVLYLDTDIIINKSLNELFELDMCEMPVAAVEDPALLYGYSNENQEQTVERTVDFKKKIYDNIGFSEQDKYFNAGVILFDLVSLRTKGHNGAFFLNYISNNRNKLICLDQDVLNGVYHLNVKWLDYIYNYRTYPFRGKDKVEIEKDMEEHAVCIHYTAKPWKKLDCIGAKEFWKYAKKAGVSYKYYIIKINNCVLDFYGKNIVPIRKKFNPQHYL